MEALPDELFAIILDVLPDERALALTSTRMYRIYSKSALYAMYQARHTGDHLAAVAICPAKASHMYTPPDFYIAGNILALDAWAEISGGQATARSILSGIEYCGHKPWRSSEAAAEWLFSHIDKESIFTNIGCFAAANDVTVLDRALLADIPHNELIGKLITRGTPATLEHYLTKTGAAVNNEMRFCVILRDDVAIFDVLARHQPAFCRCMHKIESSAAHTRRRMDLDVVVNGSSVTLKFTGASAVTVRLGPVSGADWRTFAALAADFELNPGTPVKFRDGILEFGTGIAVAASVAVGWVPEMRQKLAAAGKMLTITPRPPPYANKYFDDGPVLCAGCDRVMKYNFTGPFADRWYFCAQCAIKYCDYGGMYEPM